MLGLGMATQAVDRHKEGSPEGREKPWVCPKCGKRFLMEKGMKGHMAGVHGAKYGVGAELARVTEALGRVEQALVNMQQRDAIGQRIVELAQRKAQLEANRLHDARVFRELDFLTGLWRERGKGA